MVHFLELLGCIATGPTTEEALDRTPATIRDFLQFLQRHGEQNHRRMIFIRRMLEHQWEHLVELKERLEQSG
jgi:predicted RNase H-like HicB family nuclease